ncbi:MAG TPA: CBS domain-containing protein [Jatrophihabitantaceae bacterium]|jgi:CBS domain-containing protein
MTQALPPQPTPAATTVGQVMRPALTTVEPQAHVAAAAYLMKRAGATALVVVDGEETKRPLGIITEADIVRVVADGKDVNDVRIRDLMTSGLTVCDERTSIRDAARSMIDGRFRHLPVVGDAGVVGIIEIGDVSRALLDQQH